MTQAATGKRAQKAKLSLHNWSRSLRQARLSSSRIALTSAGLMIGFSALPAHAQDTGNGAAANPSTPILTSPSNAIPTETLPKTLPETLPETLPKTLRANLAPTLATSLSSTGSEVATVEAGGAKGASLASMIETVSIPYEEFTLDNGLKVLVHEDRKAPVVAVSVWYNIGSKQEPKGKTGFAHLFEHLMFNGSENADGDFFEPLKQIGATDVNGTTWFDRTNYFETVPTGALDRALMLESDRMGHLLGAVTQEKLDNQIGVVQNEKRQGDNQPYGLVEYEQLENLYPSGHPYHHSTIGSMDDLSNATLEDVKQWFRDNYGPNNAVLVLAGDVDLATAREKVAHWFSAIPSGPTAPQVAAPVPTLDAPLEKVIQDRVATTRIYRMWAVPGLDNPEFLPLSMGASVLGGLYSSRLDNALVRDQQIAVSVVARAEIFAQAGQFVVYANAKPGVDRAKVEAALDAEIAKFIAEGPTADEILRASTVYASGMIKGLETTGGFSGKAPTLAQGLLYQGNPAAYRQTLEQAAALTPAQVQEVTAKWLSRPVFSLVVEPGERTEGGENRGGFVVSPNGGGVGSGGVSGGGYGGASGGGLRHSEDDTGFGGRFGGGFGTALNNGSHDRAVSTDNTGSNHKTMPQKMQPAFFNGPLISGVTAQSASAAATTTKARVGPDRSSLPPVEQLTALDFPEIETATLSNGMQVYFAHRDAVPTVKVRVEFDAGYAADPRDRLGTQSLMLNLMDEGTHSLNSLDFAVAQERLGVSIYNNADADSTAFALSGLTPNFLPSLQLLADFIRNPAFDANELERIRTAQLTAIKSEMNNPASIATRALSPILFGDQHPYGIPPSGRGHTQVVETITREEITNFHQKWIRPDLARIFVVGDTSLAESVKLLEASFGDWKAPATPKPTKSFTAPIPTPDPRIILINRPNSPQSVIIGGRVLDHKGTDDLTVLESSNEIFGGGFLSRINMNLREDKGWSYGVRSIIQTPLDRATWLLYAPVQADRTGDSITELNKELANYTGENGSTDAELTRLVNGNIRELPGQFETSGDVMTGLVNMVTYGLEFDHYETLAQKYRALTTEQMDAAARQNLIGNQVVLVVVGDAEIVRPQLDSLGMKVEQREATE